MPIENEMTVRQYAKALKKAECEKWENEFARQLKAEGFIYVREHKFHPHRRWRFDFVISKNFNNTHTMFMCATNLPEHLVVKSIAVEIEGAIGWGRHTRKEGFINDCEKYNTAAAMGWRVFRFPSAMVEDGSALQFLKDEVWT